MLKVSHATMVALSGLVWMIVGCVLLPLGLNFVVGALLKENASAPHPILNFLAPYAGGLDQAAMIWIAFCLFVGFMKGKTVFAKSVKRSVDRIKQMPNPAPLSKIYTPAYYILLGSMVLLGVLVRFTTQDIRGGVDIAIGAALINGAVLYFRQAFALRSLKSL